MKRYTVVWDPDLQLDFIRTWIGANSALRLSLTGASNWVDQNLVLNPERQGRASPIDPTHRSLLVPQTGDYAIVVHYQVSAADRQVEVLSFQHSPQK